MRRQWRLSTRKLGCSIVALLLSINVSVSASEVFLWQELQAAANIKEEVVGYTLARIMEGSMLGCSNITLFCPGKRVPPAKAVRCGRAARRCTSGSGAHGSRRSSRG